MSITMARIHLLTLMSGCDMAKREGKSLPVKTVYNLCNKAFNELKNVADEQYLEQKLGDALNYMDATTGITDSDNTNIDLVKDLLSEVMEKVEEQ